MNLSDLYSAMDNAYKTLPLNDARKAVDQLYNAHIGYAIMLEGFTDKQAGIIGAEAWDRGHSGGLQEVVGCAMNLCDFCKRLLATK